jgi:hypothetical protein
MNKTVKIALMSAVVAAAGVALAAPEFLFVKDAKSNGMMMTMGKKEVIELAAYPALKLQARNVTKDHATFVFVTDKDALHGAFDYYGKALEKEGWKGAGEAMMKDGDAMKKEGDAMAKPGDAMAKPGDAMAKPGDTMGAMMKPLTEKYSFKTYTITLSAKETKTNVEVDLVLK